MQNDRASLLAPFFSLMAILSFKKKDKENNKSNTPLAPPKVDTNLNGMSQNGGDLALGGLDSSIGSLSSIDLDSDDSEDVGDKLLSMSGMSQSDLRLQELEATVNDIKKEYESVELATRAMKSEIESIKDEIGHMNESIKSLLTIYEAVSKQYNPFVDDETVKAKGTSSAASSEYIDDVDDNFESKLTEDDEMDMGLEEDYYLFDENEPLDRIIRPDDEAEDELSTFSDVSEDYTMNRMNGNARTGSNDSSNDMNRNSKNAAPQMPIINGAYEDIYALEQTKKLIDSLMNKICNERSMGKSIREADRRAFNLWVSEFKRLGGF